MAFAGITELRPDMRDVVGPVRNDYPSQGRLPFYNEGRGGRGNYQGDATFPAPFNNEVTSFNTFSPTENYGPVGSGITGLRQSKPPWWETQMGGSAYGSFHKRGPEDYSDMFKLEPGQNYSYNDLIGNKMLNPNDYFYNDSPYKRDNPLLQATGQMVGSEVPDHLIYDKIYDDDGNIEGYSWNPYKDENSPLINEWLPEEYAISPGVLDSEDIFQFRDFPWMDDSNGDGSGGLNNDLNRMLDQILPKPDRMATGGYDTANLTQTWQTIADRIGPDAANEWLASEQANSSQQANLETDEIMRIMGQYKVGPEEARRIYDEMIYGYDRV
tara:strand:- start:1877 stop:2857 length:981 start_codon:yes stop_codon:yes gene_type:complete